ncbi:hypothetical protein, partial [Hydromonas duriensis]|uniref:hypothetical protein n=1 Tax=Hydromonas duriensis TaxID=1527608 RepID=UPI0013C2A450
TATPTTETYDVTVRVNVPAGSSTSNDTCSGTTSGQGLFNTGVLSMSGASDQSASACSNTPAVSGVNLVLQKTWVGAHVGDVATIPATVGFSVNTDAYNAIVGVNNGQSKVVVVAPDEVGTLPTEVMNPNIANYFYAGSWSCSDGTNAAITVAQGGNLTIPSASVGKTLTCTLTNTSVAPDVNVTKAVTAGPTAVSGTGDQFDITYRVTVSNTNASATAYSLSDTFGFDSDVSVVGTPTITKGSNVSGTVNSAFTGSGTNTSIVSNESIAAGSTATPTTETYDIAVRVKVAATGSSTNNTCTATTGNGLFNNAQMTIAGTVKDANACATTPTAQTTQLSLQVDWSNAVVGETLTVPATTGLSTNTTAFNAVSTGANSVSSNTVVPVIGETATLPTPSFVNTNNALNYVASSSWTCSDGVNPSVSVPFGGSLTLSSGFSGATVVCKVAYSGVQVDTVKTASPAAGTSVAVGDTIQYTLKTTVSGNATQRDVVLSDTLG